MNKHFTLVLEKKIKLYLLLFIPTTSCNNAMADINKTFFIIILYNFFFYHLINLLIICYLQFMVSMQILQICSHLILSCKTFHVFTITFSKHSVSSTIFYVFYTLFNLSLNCTKNICWSELRLWLYVVYLETLGN